MGWLKKKKKKKGDSHSRKENAMNKNIQKEEVAHAQRSGSQKACLD